MRISSAFPSDYLKAADLQGRAITVTMSHVDMEKVGNDQKPILYFQGKQKGMVLNKTNATKIAEMFGDDTNNWAGGQVIIYEAMVDFKGDTVAAIRIRLAPHRGNGAQPTPQAQRQLEPALAAPQTQTDDYDDPIPF